MSESGRHPTKLLYLTEWFDPEPVFKGLRFARGLLDSGFEVEVATAFPNHPGGKVFPGYRIRAYQRQTMEGVPVHRLFVLPSHDRSGLRRMLTYCSFFVSALIFLLLRMRRYDVLYVYHPPIMPGLAAALAALVHRRPFILEIQDLWPDSVAASGMGRPWIVRLLGSLCNFTYARAERIVCQSQGMVDRLRERGVPETKLVRVYNWSNYVPAGNDASGARFPEALERAFDGRINLVYGGNLGQAQALEHVIDAVARAAMKVPELRLHLIGNGIERARIAALAAERAPDHVMVHEAVPPRVMDRIFDRADGLVVHLKENLLYEITIPSKTQHYLSAGKAIVAGLSGEAASLLAQSGAAHVVRSGDVPALADAMVVTARATSKERSAAGHRGKLYYAQYLSFEAAMERTMGLLKTVTGDI